MKLSGACLFCIAALYVGIIKANELKNSTVLLREIISFLTLMKNEICTRRTPVKEIIKTACVMKYTFLSDFLHRLSDSFPMLGEKSFGELWAESVDERLVKLPEPLSTELKKLGCSIGRYDSELQAESIENCMAAFSEELHAKASSLASNQKLSVCLTLSAGLIVTILLI